MSKPKQYAQRDHEDLFEYYLRHVDAMTGEGLHEKSAIAGELAWRDREIDRARSQLAAKDAEVTRLQNALRNGIAGLRCAAEALDGEGLIDAPEACNALANELEKVLAPAPPVSARRTPTAPDHFAGAGNMVPARDTLHQQVMNISLPDKYKTTNYSSNSFVGGYIEGHRDARHAAAELVSAAAAELVQQQQGDEGKDGGR